MVEDPRIEAVASALRDVLSRRLPDTPEGVWNALARVALVTADEEAWRPIEEAKRGENYLLAYIDASGNLEVGEGSHWLGDEWKVYTEECPVKPTMFRDIPYPNLRNR